VIAFGVGGISFSHRKVFVHPTHIMRFTANFMNWRLGFWPKSLHDNNRQFCYSVRFKVTLRIKSLFVTNIIEYCRLVSLSKNASSTPGRIRVYANRSGDTPEHRDQERTLTHSLSISQTLLLHTNNYMNLHLFDLLFLNY